MSGGIQMFDQVTEYARYGGVLPSVLEKRKSNGYMGELSIVVVDGETKIPILSGYSSRVRGFIYKHGLTGQQIKGPQNHVAVHFISHTASSKVEAIIGKDRTECLGNLFGQMAHFMNHDMLHGFNGDPEKFQRYDKELIFGGVEFFALIAHSEIFLKWLMGEPKNKDFVLNMQRHYIELLVPIAEKYMQSRDPELLRLIDYFIVIYLKCMLTLLPIDCEIVRKFGGLAQKKLYSSLSPAILSRVRLETMMKKGLENAVIKNNPTVNTQGGFDRMATGAAICGKEFLESHFPEGVSEVRVPYMIKLVLENLIVSGCLRIVPSMDKPVDLQNQFQKLYTK